PTVDESLKDLAESGVDSVGREAVINRIAAGEVVVRPANALKELMENSLDAGSTRVAIVAKSGGLKMLRIEDDGHGIRADDLPILCERFTTSKLRKYEDLSSIGTFGFRGEALASISHVAHVTVTTMTSGDDCARVAQYSESKMQGPARPCAGTRGTTIVVEDMFYNNPTRRQALSKESIEHAKVLEVVQRYAIHYPKVGFSCRKNTSSVSELTTVGGEDVTAQGVISTIYGQNLAKELFPYSLASEEPKFSCTGFASSPNYMSRSLTFILFINNRLVDSGPLKRALEAVYQSVLPRHQHPWVYLALEVNPAAIDVNVHPTKMEVQFLHEETIAQRLQETLLAQLQTLGGSRTFVSALPSPGKGAPIAEKEEKQKVPQPLQLLHLAPPAATRASAGLDKTGPAVLNPTRIRTDHRQMSLQSMFLESHSQAAQATQVSQTAQASQVVVDASAPSSAPSQPLVQSGEMSGQMSEERRAAFAEAQQLTSIEELRISAAVAGDAELSELVNKSVYVGPVTRELVLLQCEKSLCMVNIAILARECAYQRVLRLIGGVGCITLAEPLPLAELLKLGIQDPDSGYDPELHASVDIEAMATRFVTLLLEKAELLNAYFMLEIDVSGKRLKTLPNGLGLKSDMGCNFETLPLFLVRLCAEVDWEEEKPCLEGICQVIADFSAELLLPSEAEADIYQRGRAAVEELNAAVQSGEFDDIVAASAAKRQRTTEELQGLRWLHEALRRDGECQWPRELATDGTFLELASLDQLYKIFERC
ncbi:Mlh1, partial [Symbiodinium sp. KB8]